MIYEPPPNPREAAALFEEAPVGLCAARTDGGIAYVNREFCRITGRTRETLLKTSLLALLAPGDSIALGAADAPGTRSFVEHGYLRPDGSIIKVRSHATPLSQRSVAAVVLASVERAEVDGDE